jgi:predicted NAD/FAD-binding protein
MKIAVIGSGIAGLGAAWALSQHHDVTVYERDSRPGGHANTVDVSFGETDIAVDTGFIVYNEPTYPHLTNLFAELGVETKPSDMSFAFARGDLEYAGSLAGLLARPSQLRSARYRGMIRDILRFRRIGTELLERAPDRSLGDTLDAGGFGPGFRDDYIVPMAAAIWSARRNEILEFPAASFLRFFRNHGLIRISDRPPWRTVAGGSRTYVNKLVDQLGDRLRLATGVTRLDRNETHVEVETRVDSERFDHVVLAVHSDQALGILGDHATDAERDVLKHIRYEPNEAILHSDPALMPNSRRVWSSWNYVTTSDRDGSERASVTYWMNRLQSIDPAYPLFVSLNPTIRPNPDLVHRTFSYAHPQFDGEAIEAQANIAAMQGVHRTWFAGAWCGYGFHEDGLQSGLNVAAALGSPARWHDSVMPVSSSPAVPDRASLASRDFADPAIRSAAPGWFE